MTPKPARDAIRGALPGDLLVEGARRFSAVSSEVILQGSTLRVRPSQGLVPTFAEKWLALFPQQPRGVFPGAVLELPYPVDQDLQLAYIPWLATIAGQMAKLRALGMRIYKLTSRLPDEHRPRRASPCTATLRALQKSLTSVAFEP